MAAATYLRRYAPEPMRVEIEGLIALGVLPPESSAAAEIELREALIRKVVPPLTLAEAKALAGILGPDNCFGLAWSVVHLIESAPSWSALHVPLGPSPFLPTLRSRARGGDP